jgi:hypothetical protein
MTHLQPGVEQKFSMFLKESTIFWLTNYVTYELYIDQQSVVLGFFQEAEPGKKKTRGTNSRSEDIFLID